MDKLYIVYPTARYLYGVTMEHYKNLDRFYSNLLYPTYNVLVQSVSITLDKYEQI